jgi:ergothioneine biosynthesis protein EgtB
MNEHVKNNQRDNSTQRFANIIKDCLLVRKQTKDICSCLTIEDHVVQPIAEVSPPKWHLAHTTWFFEELILVRFAPDYQRFNQSYGQLFNSYYKSAGQHWLQAERGNLSRPTVAEILNYREYVDQALADLMPTLEKDIELFKLLEIGLHHEQQHQELLLMDIKYILGCNPLLPNYTHSPLAKSKQPNGRWFNFEEKIFPIGNDGSLFSFDNETPRHNTYIQSFSICSNTVSNGEFLNFIKAGGYKTPKLWLSLGWDWLNAGNIQHPLYWQKQNNIWYEYTLHGLQELDLNAPVTHISYFEADAYANWRGARLPTEQELEIYLSEAASNEGKYDIGRELEKITSSNILQPNSVSAHTGQVWCWSKSQYESYPGYLPYKGQLAEYNGKFMCNQFVLKGGCIATPQGHYRHSYRNFYAPEQRWMFSGIRLAKDI